MIRIEYWNTYNIIDVHYEGDYRNSFMLDVDLKKPEYIIDREGFENSLGEIVNTFFRWSKQYSFEVFCTESLVDALTTITMHDNVWISANYDGVILSAKVKELNCDVQWQSIDSVAKVTVSFVTNSYVVSGRTAAGCIPNT